jgi:adenosine kinase
MSIVCTGSVAYDYLMSFPGYFKDHILPDQLDKISLSFLVDGMVRHRGGTAPNIAYTLALLGDKPRLFATAGIDFEEYRSFLNCKGVDTTYTRVISDKFTASFFANTDLSNNQICSFYPGAMDQAGTMSLKELNDKPDIVIISANEVGAMTKFTDECVELGFPYLYDIGQQVVRMDKKALQRAIHSAHSVFVNEYEFELLQKHTGYNSQEIQSMVKILAVTLGENGTRIFAEGQIYNIPPVPPDRIAEPTGVGDAMRGGFLRGFMLGMDLQTCGQMGSLAATYCLEQSGTQNHSYTPAEFISRYRTHFNDDGKLDALLIKTT